MLEGLRQYGLPALRRMNKADDIVGRLAPMGVFRGWAEHFGLPSTAADPAFELTLLLGRESRGGKEAGNPLRNTSEPRNAERVSQRLRRPKHSELPSHFLLMMPTAASNRFRDPDAFTGSN